MQLFLEIVVDEYALGFYHVTAPLEAIRTTLGALVSLFIHQSVTTNCS